MNVAPANRHPRLVRRPLPTVRDVVALLHRHRRRWIGLALVPVLWLGGAVAAPAVGDAPVLHAGPVGAFGAVYWWEAPYTPPAGDVLPAPPCEGPAVVAEAAQWAVGPGGRVSLACAYGDGLVRYTALVEGPRCRVVWRGRDIERRPCVMLPVVR